MVMVEMSTFGIFSGRNVRGRIVQAETSVAEMSEHPLHRGHPCSVHPDPKDGALIYLLYLQMTLEKACSNTKIVLAASRERT